LPLAEVAHACSVYRAQLLATRGQEIEGERFIRQALQTYQGDPYLLVALSATLLHQHRWNEGREVLCRVLEQPERMPHVDAVVFNNLAWADLHLPDAQLAAEARTMSADAYRLMPWEKYIASTFGCVEALHGDAKQALAVLERVRTNEMSSAERASTLAGVAAAQARLQRQSESAQSLAAAAELDPASPLLMIVRQQLESRQLPGADTAAPAPRLQQS
jgi:predicted Zn-dependent protease